MSRREKNVPVYQDICEPKHGQPTCDPQEDMVECIAWKNNREVSD